MIGFTVVRGNDQGIPARVSAMTIEYGSPPIARRGERFFAPTHDRGAVLESIKNQQEEDCACGCAVRTMFFHAIACETDDHP